MLAGVITEIIAHLAFCAGLTFRNVGRTVSLYDADRKSENPSQKYLKFQLPRAACSNFCVGYPRMARVPPVLLST